MYSHVARKPYFFALSALLFFFILRVLGQLSVVLFQPQFLPPMNDWHSGLLPYPLLLACQLIIIVFFGKICLDFAGLGQGKFARASARAAHKLSFWGTFYMAVNFLRYALMQYLHPHGLWFSGCIPIFFHCVLASFILVLATYQHQACRVSVTAQASESFSKALPH